MSNRNLVLIPGKSATGKTASFRNLREPEGVLFLNCESGKELPFAAKFKVKTVTHPLQVIEVFQVIDTPEFVKKQGKFHTIIIDSLTYLMDMYESQIVLKSDNTMAGWQAYQQFFKELMQVHVAASSKNVIFTAHTSDVLNESEMVMECMVKVKGALMNNGIESYFNNVIACKKVPLKKIEDCKSDLLNISEEEEMLDFKYVYQTRLTKDTVNERIRGPLGLWSVKEIFIDNDLQLVLDRLQDYYSE